MEVGDTYAPWNTNEPNNNKKHEQCGALYSNIPERGMNDILCDLKEYAICEATVGRWFAFFMHDSNTKNQQQKISKK